MRETEKMKNEIEIIIVNNQPGPNFLEKTDLIIFENLRIEDIYVLYEYLEEVTTVKSYQIFVIPKEKLISLKSTGKIDKDVQNLCYINSFSVEDSRKINKEKVYEYLKRKESRNASYTEKRLQRNNERRKTSDKKYFI